MHETPLILLDRPRAPLERLDARTKLALALLWAVCVVSLPARAWLAFAAYTAVLLALLLVNWRILGRFLQRFAPALPAIAVFTVLLPLLQGGTPLWQWGPLVISAKGLAAAGRFAAAATLSIGGIALVWAGTRHDQLLLGLRGLGLPRLLVDMFGFMLRYLDVLRPELHRLADARAARTVGRGGPGPLRSGANLIGTLFLRSYDRAERVADAMVARGYTGTLRTFTRAHFHRVDYVAGPGFASLVLGIRFAFT